VHGAPRSGTDPSGLDDISDNQKQLQKQEDEEVTIVNGLWWPSGKPVVYPYSTRITEDEVTLLYPPRSSCVWTGTCSLSDLAHLNQFRILPNSYFPKAPAAKVETRYPQQEGVLRNWYGDPDDNSMFKYVPADDPNLRPIITPKQRHDEEMEVFTIFESMAIGQLEAIAVRGPAATEEALAAIRGSVPASKQAIVIIETDGPTFVAGGEKPLTAAQKAVAEELGYTPARPLKGFHAEQQGLDDLSRQGWLPRRGLVSIPICRGRCGSLIYDMDGWFFGREFGFPPQPSAGFIPTAISGSNDPN
jgi:hypothetical protein